MANDTTTITDRCSVIARAHALFARHLLGYALATVPDATQRGAWRSRRIQQLLWAAGTAPSIWLWRDGLVKACWEYSHAFPPAVPAPRMCYLDAPTLVRELTRGRR